ncbi:MAG: type III secretion system chaperone [Kiritimatiellae bacterium]|nr:type III secretion system chaperone [Kiritimatiellia bacterium]
MSRLAEAIDYPDAVPDGVSSFVFRVDGAEIRASCAEGSIRLSCDLAVEDGDLPALADYAVGRMLREDAVLAASPSGGSPFLWQEASDTAGEQALRRFFESFMDSCDWWRSRVAELGPEEGPAMHEIVIRP